MSKYDAQLRRLRKQLKPPGPDAIDYTQPPDPLQVAILDEIDAWLEENPDGKKPLKDRPQSVHAEMVRVCVGRALVNADLPAEEIEDLAPQYVELFDHYFAELEDS